MYAGESSGDSEAGAGSGLQPVRPESRSHSLYPVNLTRSDSLRPVATDSSQHSL